ncbi:MAG: hypothetical protein SOZ51_04780 [Eubacteriales bacterium]|nr:hypothetical protein [Eubacteriales bacterium]
MIQKKSSGCPPTARLCGILLFSVAIFYAAVCTPVYQWSSTDVAVSEVFLLIWDFLQSIVRFSFFWIAAAVVLVTVQTRQTTLYVLLIAVGASLLLHFGSLGVGLLMMRDLDSIGADLLGALLSVALDAVQLLLFRLIAFLILERKPSASVPVSAMLLCAAVPSAAQILNRVRYDIAVGAPTGKGDLIVMIASYLADLASIAIGYLAVLLIADRLLTEKEKRA